MPRVEALDERVVPSPVGAGSIPVELPQFVYVPGQDYPSLAPEARLNRAANEAVVEQLMEEHRAIMVELNAQLRLIESLKAETWYSQALGAIDRAIRVLIESGVPMLPTVP